MLENTPDINTYQSLLTLMESLFQVSSKYRSSLILSETVLLSVSAKRKLHNLNYSQTQCQCVQHTEEKDASPFFSCQSTCSSWSHAVSSGISQCFRWNLIDIHPSNPSLRNFLISCKTTCLIGTKKNVHFQFSIFEAKNGNIIFLKINFVLSLQMKYFLLESLP